MTHLGSVSVDSVAGSVSGGTPRVPDPQLLVVSHGTKERLVEKVPGDVLHHRSVSSENRLGVYDLVLLGGCVDVPQADGVVI